MPGFFNSMTQAVASYLRLLKEQGAGTVANADKLEDRPLAPESSVEQDGLNDYTDVVAESALDDARPPEGQNSPMNDFVSQVNRGADSFFQPENARIDNTPRGIRLLTGIIKDRIALFLPGMRRKTADARSHITKLFDVLSHGLSLERYRPDIVAGHIVGRHSRFYLLLSYLNEIVNPRGESVDLLAYFRDPVDPATGEILRWTKLSPEDTGLSAPIVAGVLAETGRNRPERLRNLAQGEPNVRNVDRANFLQVADQYLIASKARMRGLTEDLAAGRITVQQYRRMMINEIKRNVIAQVILNIGGVGNLNDEILASVHQRIRQDVESLDLTIKEITGRGNRADDLFGTDAASAPDNRGRAPQIDAETLATQVSGQAVTSPANISAVNIPEDSYVEEGAITAADVEASGQLAEGGYQEGQQAFRTLVAANANEYQLLEVRRLEEGVENCEFCISWADKPMPPGQLPDIGDPGCLGVRYNTGGCHCKMDSVSEDEAESGGEGAGEDAG